MSCFKKSVSLTIVLLFAVMLFRAEPEESDPPFSQIYLVSLVASPFVCGVLLFCICQWMHRKKLK